MLSDILEIVCALYPFKYSYDALAEIYEFYYKGTCVLRGTTEFLSDCHNDGIIQAIAVDGIMANIVRVENGLPPLCLIVNRERIVTLNEECPIV